MMESTRIEKFSTTELTGLRNELMQAGLDTWQAAEVISGFLTGHGYGVSAQHVRDMVPRIEGPRCTPECMQAELEKVAYVQ